VRSKPGINSRSKAGARTSAFKAIRPNGGMVLSTPTGVRTFSQRQ